MPAHSRLYADHFRKQQRLEEERRLRCGRCTGTLASHAEGTPTWGGRPTCPPPHTCAACNHALS
jgi:hypothetical protein